MQQQTHSWTSLAENPDPIQTPGSVQTDPPHNYTVASSPSWENDIYTPPAADGLVSHIGTFQPPIDTEYPSWASGVYIYDSHPNDVSGGEIFPQSGGPLIQTAYQPHSAGLISTLEHPQTSHVQLSASGSQGVSLIASGDYVRPEMLARWLC